MAVIETNREITLDMEKLPRHVAMIMDGNGRWAKRRKQPRLFGHRAGAETVREMVETCRELGIEYLTLYAFSSENWRRPEEEVSGLMSILQKYLQGELRKMLQNDIRLRAIGDHNRLPEQVRQTLFDTIQQTAGNKSLTLTLALSYGGRDEMIRAMRKQAQMCLDGTLTIEEISEESFPNLLDTGDTPDPDLMIRTGGEARLSNFLLWQISYAEIYFTDVMWPEFRREVFLQALSDYQNRERRFGRTGEQVQQS